MRILSQFFILLSFPYFSLSLFFRPFKTHQITNVEGWTLLDAISSCAYRKKCRELGRRNVALAFVNVSLIRNKLCLAIFFPVCRAKFFASLCLFIIYMKTEEKTNLFLFNGRTLLNVHLGCSACSCMNFDRNYWLVWERVPRIALNSFDKRRIAWIHNDRAKWNKNYNQIKTRIKFKWKEFPGEKTTKERDRAREKRNFKRKSSCLTMREWTKMELENALLQVEKIIKN